VEQPPRLACLEGAPAPLQLAADLLRLGELSDDARARLGEVLGQVLPDPVDAGAEDQLRAFAERFDVDPMQLGQALRAARFLVRAAARIDLAATAFVDDLRLLARAVGAERDAEDLLVATLSPQFEPAKALVLREAASKSIAGHGKVLVGVDWRVDRVIGSSQARALSTAVAWVTLRFEEHGEKEAVSFQATPAMLEALRQACASALG
jgi:hypothetical protein